MKTIERRPIKGCTNFEIDTNGKVWNTVLNKKVKEYVNPAGFSYVVLDRKIRTIAYLMKAAFFQNDPNICIRHKDGNRRNNKLSNLYTFFDGSETLDKQGNERKGLAMEVDPQTNQVIKFWDSLAEACRHYGISKDSMQPVTRKPKVIDGRKFDYYTNTLDGIGLFDYSDGNHLIQIFDEHNNLIGEVKTLEDAKKLTGDSTTAIRTLILTKGTSKRGYKYGWKLSTAPIPEKEPKPIKVKEAIKVKQPIKVKEAIKKLVKPKVCQYSLTGELIQTFETVKEAIGATGISQAPLYAALSNNRKTAGGYVWKYEGEPFDYIPKMKVTKAITKPNLRKRVCQYSLKGQLINTFDSITEAANALNIQANAISQTMNGKRTAANDCVWRLEGDAFDKYPLPTRPFRRKVYQMKPAEDGNGFVIVNEWNSLREAADELGYPLSTLGTAASMRGKRIYKDGYYYAYANY